METDDRYEQAVDALRGTIEDYGEDSQAIAATAADIVVNELFKDDSFLHGANRRDVAKTLFVAATAMVLMRDQMVKDGDHLLEVDESGELCIDDDCTYEHLPVDTERVVAIVDGFECGVAAVVGMALAVVDLAGEMDPDKIDWSKGL